MLDSCDNDPDDDGNAFSRTGALTIKSSSGSSGGLISALGLSRDNSIDSDDYQPHSSISSHDGSVDGALGNLSLAGSTGSLNGSALSPATSINFDLHKNKDNKVSLPKDNAFKVTPGEIIVPQGKVTLDNRSSVKHSEIPVTFGYPTGINNGTPSHLEDLNKKGFPNIGTEFGAQLGQLFPQNPSGLPDQPSFFQQRKVIIFFQLKATLFFFHYLIYKLFKIKMNKNKKKITHVDYMENR